MTSGAHFGDQAPSTTPQAGDAGANFLSSLLNAPTDAEGAKRVSDGGQQLKALAQSGGFAINEAGFQRYIAACDDFLEGYHSRATHVHLLALQAEMGSHDYAKEVAGFNVTVASGDHESLIPNLEKMADGIRQAREALEIARKNYRETEEAHNQTFAKFREHQS